MSVVSSEGIVEGLVGALGRLLGVECTVESTPVSVENSLPMASDSSFPRALSKGDKSDSTVFRLYRIDNESG